MMNQSENNEELPVVLYTSADGQVRVNALVKDETLWHDARKTLKK